DRCFGGRSRRSGCRCGEHDLYSGHRLGGRSFRISAGADDRRCSCARRHTGSLPARRENTFSNPKTFGKDMKNYIDLSNRVALVTGAASGIGRATALALAEQGAAVVINYHRNEAGAESVMQQIIKAGGKAITSQADVTRSADVKRLVAESTATFGA